MLMRTPLNRFGGGTRSKGDNATSYVTSEISGNALPEIFRFWHGYAEGFRYAQTELTGGGLTGTGLPASRTTRNKVCRLALFRPDAISTSVRNAR